MAQFFKEKNFKFRLKDLNETETFTIWKAWDKRNEDIKDSQGVLMTFPIKEGHLMGTDNNLREITALKFMKRVEFTKLYPNLNKQTKFNRDIIVNGAEWVYAFSMSSNNRLKTLLETIKSMGSDPLTVEYEQSFDSTKTPAEMYNIKLSTTPSPQVVVAPTPTSTTHPVIPPTPVQPEYILASNEQEVVSAIKSMAQIPDEIAIVNILKNNKIPEIRAKGIYNNVFK